MPHLVVVEQGKSYFWGTDPQGVTPGAGAVGDGAAPYTQDELMRFHIAMFHPDVDYAGVMAGIDNQLNLAVLSTPPSVSIQIGWGWCHGFPFELPIAASHVLDIPDESTVGVVAGLYAHWADQKVRVAFLFNDPGITAIPDHTAYQTVGVEWLAPLFDLVLSAGSESSRTDHRVMLHRRDT